jgi:DNA-binding Xre family transcriptional regulator
MLYFNFQRILKARGIDKPFKYLVRAGYSGNYATRVANNRIKRLDLTEIERLCELFNCTPNDFLDWVPDTNQATDPKHPLISLKRDNKVIELTKMMNAIPLDKLEEIESIIKSKMSE